MEFWRDRYVYPGWLFVGSLFILSRFLPVPITETIPLHEQWSIGLVIASLFAGAPLGYLIYAIVEFWWRLFGGAGRLVNRQRLRSGLLEICNRLAETKSTELEPGLLRLKAILENVKTFPDQALYVIFWQSHGANDSRSGTHRRWETVHISLGIICGLILSVIISFIYACNIGLCKEYFSQNVIFLVLIMVVILLLFRCAALFAKEASSQENVWVELFLARVEEKPEVLFKVLQL